MTLILHSHSGCRRLIDTAYLGRLGTNALGGAGAAIAAQYSVSKLYNDPLVRSTISLVAAQEGDEPAARANAVSTALLLALAVGIIQGCVFFVFAGPVLNACCVGPTSPMRASAIGYLRVCSLGAPGVCRPRNCPCSVSGCDSAAKVALGAHSGQATVAGHCVALRLGDACRVLALCRVPAADAPPARVMLALCRVPAADVSPARVRFAPIAPHPATQRTRSGWPPTPSSAGSAIRRRRSCGPWHSQ